MSLELVNTLASIGTFAVIAVTAIAALVQLGHMRSSNQLTALVQTITVFEDPEFQRKLAWFRSEFPSKMKDPAFLAELHYPGSLSRTEHPELSIADLWEQTGVLIKYGLVSEAAFMDLAAGMVVTTWSAMAEMIRIRREAIGDTAYENFEYLAARAIEWGKRHTSNYPSGTPMLLPRSPK